MKLAITGGTGFVGHHLAQVLAQQGHEVVILARGQDQRHMGIRALPHVSFVACDVGDEECLVRALTGCDGIAHCAGINREIGRQTYKLVHVEGVVEALPACDSLPLDLTPHLAFTEQQIGQGSPAVNHFGVADCRPLVWLKKRQ